MSWSRHWVTFEKVAINQSLKKTGKRKADRTSSPKVRRISLSVMSEETQTSLGGAMWARRKQWGKETREEITEGLVRTLPLMGRFLRYVSLSITWATVLKSGGREHKWKQEDQLLGYCYNLCETYWDLNQGHSSISLYNFLRSYSLPQLH